MDLHLHFEFRPLLLCVFALWIIFRDARGQKGFTSIDCGLPFESRNYYDDKTGILYSTDETFIDTGINSAIDPKYLNDSVDQHLWTVRNFPRDTRNCYNLTALEGKGKRYLIRATFMYGNYDRMNQPPTFRLLLGVEIWDTVELHDSTSVITKEIVHVPLSNYLYVCLVNLGSGTPFISTLELRQLNPNAYVTQKTGESLTSFRRWNLAPADPNKVIRYPDDIYDRIWQPYASPDKWVSLRTPFLIDVSNYYVPPVKVMQSAVTPQIPNQSLQFPWKAPNPSAQFYEYFHFAEVVQLRRDEYRAFHIDLNDVQWRHEAVVPLYRIITTIFATRGFTRATFNYSLVKTDNSTLPPILNALEVYLVKPFLKSQTDENDVGAVLNIKSTYGVKRDWQGDPCLPQEFIWDGLACIIYDNTSIPPRIKSLNLSSSRLTGNVSSYLSNLQFLENLDMSNNDLNGPIPDFLAELPQLKVLNLSGNHFTSPIPQKLLDKAKSGLQLRADAYESGTPDTCDANQCKSDKSHKFVVPVVVSLAGSLVILTTLILIWRLRLRMMKPKVDMSGGISNRKEGFLEMMNIQFTYSDLQKITSNFQRVLGKGGFGTVYHGLTADGKQVAVKLLSQSSAQGYNEFQTEAQLLTRVHHRNLTSLVGYCYEGSHMALVYEYMANGNLREHILVSDDHEKVLSWSVRLQIALDAAQGLDYLHNGCKPPTIHRDVKSANILLNENFEGKLADFGLSRAYSIDGGPFVSTRIIGTPGFLDPEYYQTHRLHEKSDVYSLGIVILQLITGRPVITGSDDNELRHITQWVSFLLSTGDVRSIMDPKLRGMYDINSVWKALEVAMACASPTSSERPAMALVLTELVECLAAERARVGGQHTCENDLLDVNAGILGSQIVAR